MTLDPRPSTLDPRPLTPSRCGRDAHADALCVVVAYPSAIDQWVMRHPARLLARPLEACVIDAANPVVLRQHMLCAAAEQPLGGQLDDASLFGGQRAFDEAVRALKK